MNSSIRNLNYNQVIFYDLEMASCLPELDVDSELFKIFQYKKRNRDTDELPSIEETQRLWKKNAALDPITGRIISGVVGVVKDDEIHLKSFKGEEKDVITGVVEALTNQPRIWTGFNSSAYDSPYLRKRFQILGLGHFPEKYNDIGKKSWDMDKVSLDIMSLFKGSSFYSNNLDELCWAFNVPSPKHTGVKGAEVSQAFWNGRIDEIVTYNEADVKATINLFRVLKGDKIIN